MHKVDKTKMTQKFLPWIGRLTRLPVMTSCDPAPGGNKLIDESLPAQHVDQCCSGGYNEAFVFENWASYGPRH